MPALSTASGHRFHPARLGGLVSRGLLALACLAAAAAAQNDSGWVPIFNGKNWDGLYIRSGRAELRNMATQNYARIESDGSIYMANPGPAGALCTKADLSYYHARIQYHFSSSSGTPNAGILYHVDSLDWLPTDAVGSSTVDRVPSLQPSCNGSWFPKGWEAQMRRGQSGAVYGVANVWGETTVKDGKWDPAGDPRPITPSYNSGPKNVNPSKGEWPDGPNDWVTMEILVYGADSAIHVVNGTRVFKMTRLRHNRLMVPCGGGGGTWGTGAQLPLTNGKHCVQIEGADITYRAWQMRPLPKPGGPTAVGGAAIAAPRPYALAVRRAPGQRLVSIAVTSPSSPLSHRGPLTVEIHTHLGVLLRAFTLTGGSETVAWDLTDSTGRPAAAGLYLVRLASDRVHASRPVLLD